MKQNMEIIGLRCELVGLALVLVATAWQLMFTDFYEKIPADSARYVQENVNLALLVDDIDLANLMTSTDEAKRVALANAIDDRARREISKAVGDRQHIDIIEAREGSVFRWVRAALFGLGSVLVLAGKYITMSHKHEAALKTGASAPTAP